jgi:putative serine protease PepD
MHEGKPTNRRWWSRPRPSGPDDIPAGSEPIGSSDPPGGPDGPHGAAEADAAAAPDDPDPATGTEAPAASEEPAEEPSGDYVVAPARPATGAPSAANAAGGSGAAPQSADAPGSTPAAAQSERFATGTPSRAGTGEVPDAEEPADAVPPSNPAPPTDALAHADAPPAPMDSGQSAVEAAGHGAATDPPAPAGPASDAAAPPERRHPLHEPDAYSTPPYGEPGPWAPAPPVQHPGTTPPPGVPIPPPPGKTPAHGTPVPGPMPPYGSPAPTAPAAVPPYAPQPPLHQHALPPTAPQSTVTAAPYTAPVGPVMPGGHARGGAAGGRWHPYDPWAAPLQQNGAAPKDGRRGRRGAVIAVVLVALLAGLLGGVLGADLEQRDGGPHITLPQAGEEPKNRAPDSIAGIAASALPSVVTIHVRGAQVEGTGTGFVLDGQGHILTNNHVIQPAGAHGDISVTFSGGQSAKASVVGHDTGYDLAVIRVSGVSGLKPLPLGNSDNVQVGDPVVAIGAPFDLANTVTAGIISAKERPITTQGSEGSDSSDVSYVDALQTDAPINPGNSGGPLVDSKARVIGINSAIRSADSGQDSGGGQAGSIGLGFAIPVNQARRVAEELINTGSATHPVIGVTLDMNYRGDGARVAGQAGGGGPAVIKGGPADRAGLRAGDVVTQVDGAPVHTGEELIVKVRSHRPGDRLQLTLRRGGSTKKVTLVLGSAKGD